MKSTQRVRCPRCGHVTPRPTGRDHMTCACGLRLVIQEPAAGRAHAQALFAFLAIACMLTAAADLVRRLH